MATSEILTTEDIDALDSVIQLKPHQKDIEFSTVTKSKEGDLVPLDELYEKTGQETIDKIVAGFESLLKYQKLTKEHGLLLKIEGAENWLDLPDKINAIKGGENFIKKLKDGFIKIIKKIIAFIKAVCTWLYRRLASLLGFRRFKEEQEFIRKKVNQNKKNIIELYRIMGIDIDYNDLAKEIKDEVYDGEKLLLLYDNKEKYVDVFESVRTISLMLPQLSQQFHAMKSSINNIEFRLEDAMRSVKIGVMRNVLLKKDVIDLKHVMAEFSRKISDSTAAIQIYTIMMEKIYGVNVKGVGLANVIKSGQEQYKTAIKATQIKLSSEVYARTAEVIEKYYAERESFNIPFVKKDIDKLRALASEKDADIIAKAAELVNDPDVLNSYMEYMKNLRGYTLFLEESIKAIGDADRFLSQLGIFNLRISLLINTMLYKNYEQLDDEILSLTEEDKEKFRSGEKALFDFDSVQTQFLKRYPDMKIPVKISVALTEFWKTKAGENTLTAGKNFIEGLKTRFNSYK